MTSQPAEKIALQTFRIRTCLHSLLKNSTTPLFVSGHGFSRAIKALKENVGFSPCGLSRTIRLFIQLTLRRTYKRAGPPVGQWNSKHHEHRHHSRVPALFRFSRKPSASKPQRLQLSPRLWPLQSLKGPTIRLSSSCQACNRSPGPKNLPSRMENFADDPLPVREEPHPQTRIRC